MSREGRQKRAADLYIEVPETHEKIISMKFIAKDIHDATWTMKTFDIYDTHPDDATMYCYKVLTRPIIGDEYQSVFYYKKRHKRHADDSPCYTYGYDSNRNQVVIEIHAFEKQLLKIWRKNKPSAIDFIRMHDKIIEAIIAHRCTWEDMCSSMVMMLDVLNMPFRNAVEMLDFTGSYMDKGGSYRSALKMLIQIPEAYELTKKGQ